MTVPHPTNRHQTTTDGERKPEITSPWARLAFCLLSLGWTAVGWWILLSGGFRAGLGKRSLDTVWVDGLPGLLMAGIFLALGAISLQVVLTSLRTRPALRRLGVALVIVPPALYLLTT